MGVPDLQPVDRLQVGLKASAGEPILQAGGVALVALAGAQAGEVAIWFVVALLAGASVSGSV